MALALALLLAPGALSAQGLGKENCRQTSAIVATAIEGRRAGERAAAIKARLTTGPEAVKPPYDATVPTLVDWVFALDRAQLTPVMAREFEAQCLKY
ncbi:MAG: hypothetical protein RIG84_08345 [Roseovarius sp.]